MTTLSPATASTVKKDVDAFLRAATTQSIPGELCKVVGSIGAGLGGLLMVASIASGSGAALFFSGGITALAALAGAPVAALGSIATQQKRTAKLLEFQIRRDNNFLA